MPIEIMHTGLQGTELAAAGGLLFTAARTGDAGGSVAAQCHGTYTAIAELLARAGAPAWAATIAEIVEQLGGASCMVRQDLYARDAETATRFLAARNDRTGGFGVPTLQVLTPFEGSDGVEVTTVLAPRAGTGFRF